jgi:peptidoglycan/xylan/chitin deacetylase (PgdA/CDA1 family)
MLVLSGVINRRRRRSGLVILMLHKVNDRPDPLPLTLTPGLFECVIREIMRGHEIVTLDDCVRDGRVDVSGNRLRFALTFDDGYRDNYELAFPILQRFNVPATIYLSTDHVNGKREFWHEQLTEAIMASNEPVLDLSGIGYGRHSLRDARERHQVLVRLNALLKFCDQQRRDAVVEQCVNRLGACATCPMLTWDMARKMHRAGIAFGSHTASHPILSREPRERVQAEVRDSKTEIERHLGGTVTAFAYPNGTTADFSDSVAQEVAGAGYRHACTTVPGINDEHTNPLFLRRINIHNGMCSRADGNFDSSLFWAKVLNIL